MFAYTATLADAGKVLRLALSDNGATAATRSAFDDLNVTVSVIVPEPTTGALAMLTVLAGSMWRRRRSV